MSSNVIHGIEPTEHGYSRLLCDHSFEIGAYRMTSHPDLKVTPRGQMFSPMLSLVDCPNCLRIARQRAM